MIPFPVALVGILLGSLPAFVGLFVAVAVGRSRPRYLAAFSIGVFLWFFSDSLGDSSYLGVNEGLSGGISHMVLVVLFAVAVLAFFAVEGGASRSGTHGGVATDPSLAIPILVAAALSVHGLGEGVGYGSLASSTSSTSLIEAFGGYAPATSYVLHKILEPAAIGACYSSFFLGRGASPQGGARWLNLVLAGTIFVVPTLIGAGAGYFLPFDATYLFALGGGAAVYVLFKLVQVLFEPSNPFSSYGESLRIAVLALLGFLSIYAAAIFHSVV